MKANYDYTLDRQPDRPVAISRISAPCTCPTSWSTASPSAIKVHRGSGRWSPRTSTSATTTGTSGCCPVPMRIDDGGEGQGGRGQGTGQGPVRPVPARAERGGGEPILDLGGDPVQALLRVRGDARDLRRRSPAPPTSMLAAYERLTSAITEDEISSLPPDGRGAEAQVQGCLLPPPAGRRPTSTSATCPRTGCGPTGSPPSLTAAGFHVLREDISVGGRRQHPRRGTATAAESAVRTIAVLVRRLPAIAAGPRGVGIADRTDDPAGASRTADPGPGRRGHAGRPFADRTVVDLTRRNAAQAKEELLRVLG